MNVPDKKENSWRFSYSHRGRKTGERVLLVLRKKHRKKNCSYNQKSPFWIINESELTFLHPPMEKEPHPQKI